MISVLIPAYNVDCTGLVRQILAQAEGLNGNGGALNVNDDPLIEIVVAEDGSTDATSLRLNAAMAQWPHCRYIVREQNVGRAAIRNYLASQARGSWMLFLDADVAVERADFLSVLLAVTEQEKCDVACGAYNLRQGDSTNLRWLYEQSVQPLLTVTHRKMQPFANFHTCNFLIRSTLMRSCPFDERFRWYGYEDVFFGRCLQEKGVRMEQIDAPVTLISYESNAAYMSKTLEALRTLSHFRQELRASVRLLQWAEQLRRWHVDLFFVVLFRLLGHRWHSHLVSSFPSVRLFHLYRLSALVTLLRGGAVQ